MYLIISSATPQDSRVLLVKNGKISKKVVPFKDGKRGDMLVCIDALLRTQKSTMRSIKGIIVVSGPGHFSCLRTGISIANTIGWALNIPVVGIAADEFSSDAELIAKGQAQLKKAKKFKSVLPAYGKEPNITKAKHTV